MISQYRGDEAGTRVYGGGPPPPVPGVRVIGLEALGEQEQPVANFERDIETMVQTAVAEHARVPFRPAARPVRLPDGFGGVGNIQTSSGYPTWCPSRAGTVIGSA